jgi:hypothetical protein
MTVKHAKAAVRRKETSICENSIGNSFQLKLLLTPMPTISGSTVIVLEAVRLVQSSEELQPIFAVCG